MKTTIKTYLCQMAHRVGMKIGHFYRVEGESPWMCLVPEIWEGTDQEDLVRADMTKDDGTEYEHGDRRQVHCSLDFDLR